MIFNKNINGLLPNSGTLGIIEMCTVKRVQKLSVEQKATSKFKGPLKLSTRRLND